MADWKQITARIRRARTSKDPAGQLSNLYEKTRDAMVAFELARYLESSRQTAEAVKWYATAAERFRRADWKTKAQEAATRLSAGQQSDVSLQTNLDATFEAAAVPPPPPISVPEPALPFEQNAAAFETLTASASELSPSARELENSQSELRPRRRGRRGGRNRRRSSPARESAPSSAPAANESAPSRRSAAPIESSASRSAAMEKQSESASLPLESLADAASAGTLRGRYGDPGLSSRLSLLEMQLRRLLTCVPAKLDEADRAPVGPGVLLLTDSDLTTYYFVEACQTLRLAIGSLLRGGASRRGAESIKPQLAQHLGIAEARVGKYLADHCVVRWLQLDEGASHFAHFVVAVLRPILNE